MSLALQVQMQDNIFRGALRLLIVSSPKRKLSPEADTHIAFSYFEIMVRNMGLVIVWDGLFEWVLAA